MQTFTRWFFFAFGLRRRTNVRRTPAALQVDHANVIPLRRDHRGPQQPAPFRVGIEIQGQGLQYIKPIATHPRAA